MSRSAFWVRLAEELRREGSLLLGTVLFGEWKGRPLLGERAFLSGGRMIPSSPELSDFWAEAHFPEEGLPARQEAPGGGLLLTERLAAPSRLVILGGGYISQALCPIAALLGYRVTVLDDRPQFACRERFGSAEEILCLPFGEALSVLPRDPAASYVIATRGHQHDLVCLRELILRPFAYLGMLGSRKKTALLRRRLEEEGVPPGQLERLWAPVGLDIGAQSPEEIAVSIAAQLVEQRRAARACPVEEGLLSALSRPPYVLASIIAKEGSAPRGVGARMAVFPDGTCAGTIGGGKGEALAAQEALLALEEKRPRLFTCSMTGESAEEEALVCGGQVQILLDPVF